MIFSLSLDILFPLLISSLHKKSSPNEIPKAPTIQIVQPAWLVSLFFLFAFGGEKKKKDKHSSNITNGTIDKW